MKLPNSDDTIVAISTPSGYGGIGVIRISGNQAFPITNALVQGNQDFTESRSHTIHHCFIRDTAKLSITDEVLVSVFKSPQSYTGENVIEISAHGNPQILARIVELAIGEGCRQAAPGEFTLRAFQNGRIDLLQAESVADLIAAEGSAFQQAAMYQLSGKLSEYIGNLRNELVEIGALFEAYTDFPDEDIPQDQKNELCSKIENVGSRLRRLADSYSHGQVLRSGIQIPIIGPPNAGKSSLFNAILAEERAIVTEIPGTTRDSISESIDLNGIVVRFIDTAGMRDTEDLIEAAGVSRSRRETAAASMIIVVFDISVATPASMYGFVRELGDKTIILALNKVDLLSATRLARFESELKGTLPVFVSAKELSGIGALLDRIKKLVSPTTNSVTSEPNILTNHRHYRSIVAASEGLREVQSKLVAGESYELLAFDLRQSIDSLEEILGRVTNEDLLAEIFSRFCIGK